MTTFDEQLIELRQQWKPFEAVELIRRELGLPRHRAKQYLYDHSAWHDALANWDKTLDELEQHAPDA
jgi:hypothetical protein